MKKEIEEPFLNLDKFPPTTTNRTVYFEYISEQEKSQLKQRGYNVIQLLELPHETEPDCEAYLAAILKGMSEGTIYCSMDRLKAIELDMKYRGMLNKSDNVTKVNVNVSGDMKDILDWQSSRHTLMYNSTIDTKQLKDKQ
jgi:hypothetical protein